MQNNEQIERARTIGALFGAFGQGADETRIAIYVRMLKDIPVDVLKVTAEKVMMESKFLPTIAELVEATRSLVAEAEPNTRVKTWAEAWSEIEKAMYRTPWGRIPTFSTPEIAEAVFSFGWNTLHTAEAREMPTIRAQIRRMYEDICARRKEQANNRYAMSGDKNALLRGNRSSGLTKIGDIGAGALESGKKAC